MFILSISLSAQTNQPFDGTPWKISTGNLSVTYIQHSPVGAYPQTNYFEAPPSIESQAQRKNLGLTVNEDYVAWGAVEPTSGHWDWRQHDAMEHDLHAAGLKYVIYDWIHFPPVWLRDQQKDQRTLMRCVEHNQECNYLSIFDPRTITYYDHFYKNLHDHFGDKLDMVYACILGPYGEGNYPLMVPDWVNMGHCHECYWCNDDFAVKAFQATMKKKYSSLRKLNRAWETKYKSFEEILPLKGPPQLELATAPLLPSVPVYSVVKRWGNVNNRHWLDFITWYHQAIIDFTEQSVRALLKYYPADKVKTKPGGNALGVNPIAWGTYCPGYAKMAGPLHITLQPADCQGAVFGDKWMGTAYQFYGVKESTEPAGDLDDKSFARRMFSDASCGATYFFTYEFEKHAADIKKYIHLITGHPGETEIAVYCPTTLYRLGGDLKPTIDAAPALRDLCEFDVLDEILITDGALTAKKYKTLLIFQADIVDQPILDKITKFMHKGGHVITIGQLAIKNVEGQPWTQPVVSVTALNKDREWLKQLVPLLTGQHGVDGKLDSLWTCRRQQQTILFNPKDKTAEAEVNGQTVQVAGHTIWSN